ncbi:MAG: sigma-70 family RNA polymerase sigma factor [Kiritimatiellae bacterium]|nr:sigma-70 family RNA polymerase sigma factor [Kiritimatiellia bacterium]
MDKSFSILVRDYHEMVFCYLLSFLEDRHEAEDLTQDAFVVAYRKLDTFEQDRDFGAWVRGIARNLARSRRRKSGRLAFMELDQLEQQVERSFARPAGTRRNIWQDRLAALSQCLTKLDGVARKVVELFYAQGTAAGEIARQLGMSLEAVWQRLSRARRGLKTCIDGELAREGGLQ